MRFTFFKRNRDTMGEHKHKDKQGQDNSKRNLPPNIRYFEAYTYNTGRNWKETSYDQLKKDMGDSLPSQNAIKCDENGLFWWVEHDNWYSYICNCPLVGLLYNHQTNEFLYPTPNNILKNGDVYSTKKECEDFIKAEDNKHRGEMYIQTKEQVEAAEQRRRMESMGGNMGGSGFQHFTVNFN